MTKRYRSRIELEGASLKHGDHIIFDVLNARAFDYRVNSDGYLGINDSFNDVIFVALGISDAQGFCDKAYGYELNSKERGQFPYCRKKDYKALKRVALALFDEDVEHNVAMKLEKEKEKIRKAKAKAAAAEKKKKEQQRKKKLAYQKAYRAKKKAEKLAAIKEANEFNRFEVMEWDD